MFRQGLGVEPWRTSNGYNKKPTGLCDAAERHSSGYFCQTTQVTSPMASLSKETSSTDFRPNWVEKDVGCWNATSRLRLARPRCSVRPARQLLPDFLHRVVSNEGGECLASSARGHPRRYEGKPEPGLWQVRIHLSNPGFEMKEKPLRSDAGDCGLDSVNVSSRIFSVGAQIRERTGSL